MQYPIRHQHRRESEKMVLVVDEGVQGKIEEISDLSELKEKVNELLDEQVMGVKIIRRAKDSGPSQVKPNETNYIN